MDEQTNARRCYLIDKEIDGTISETERLELADLQDRMHAYRQRVAPLPIEEAKAVYNLLLKQKQNKVYRE